MKLKPFGINMFKLNKKNIKKANLPPGTLKYTGTPKDEKVTLSVINYSGDNFKEEEYGNIDSALNSLFGNPGVVWLNINGVHNADIISKTGGHFNLHPLLLEDILNTGQRPKFDDYGEYMFIVLKMVYYNEEKDDIIIEQLSLVLGANYVLFFQEQKGDTFDFVRERLRKSKGRIRKSGADYLAYSLIDSIVDNYFVILENFGEKIEETETLLVSSPTPETLTVIHKLKRQIIFLRRTLWPLREIISGLERAESKLINKGTYIYLRDVYDHTVQVIETIETFRDMAMGMLDIYLSSVSNKMNEVMKVLTIISTIFIPLTFIAGIYGMNFEFMPELSWRWGYFAVWGIYAVVVIMMLLFFKRKKWL